MSVVVDFPKPAQSKGLQRVQATYTVREISRQFGLSEHSIRKWTREGIIQACASTPDGELRYDFHALTQFRRARELRNLGMSSRQIEAELNGQLNLFPEKGGRLLQLPVRLSPFEEALILHEQGDRRAVEMYTKAIQGGECISDAYCNLGILDYEASNLAGAFDQFTKALRYDPRHFEAHFNLAHLYFEAGEFRLARLHYDISAVIEPSSASVHFNLGLIHAINGDLVLAITALHRARDLAAEDEIAQIEELLRGLQSAVRTPDARTRKTED
jgi:DNA-binding transcriptional MerR regulator